MAHTELKGWNNIVYTILKTYFSSNEFKLKDLYEFEPHFKILYPENYHIKDKLRQTLQNLRDKGLLEFVSRGVYNLIPIAKAENLKQEEHQQLVYLLSNESIQGWVKIGRTNQIERRLKELYNTSVPLPFKLEESIETNSKDESIELEKCIHSIIDTINPELRKNTEASRREFFKLTVSQGKEVFNLVYKIMGISPLYIEGSRYGNNIYFNKK